MVTVPVALLMARLGRSTKREGMRAGNRDRASISWAVGGMRWVAEAPRETNQSPAGHPLLPPPPFTSGPQVPPPPGAHVCLRAGAWRNPRPCPALGLPLAARRYYGAPCANSSLSQATDWCDAMCAYSYKIARINPIFTI